MKRITIYFATLAASAVWAQPPSFNISTIAGTGVEGYTGNGGPAIAAELDDPRGIVTDPNGIVYFCDRDNNVVRKIDLNGIITTIAGTGVAGYNGDNIAGTSAQLSEPWRVTLDPAGNLYIADAGNNRIRKLNTSGIITTVVGTGSPGYTGDGGAATSATLRIPEQAELDAFGNMYIADSGNNVIRKVNASGIISTYAGTGFDAASGDSNVNPCGPCYGGDGGPATKALLNLPISVALDAAGDLWISDQGNDVIRYVSAATGNISTYAGIFNDYNYTGDGGPATKATFGGPAGIALDTAGDLYVTDYGNNVLREILANGNIYTVAGNGVAGYSGDGGPATKAELYSLRQVAVGTFGDIYIADSLNNAVRELTPSAAAIVGHVTNAFGNVAIIAENTWIALKGSNLANTTREWEGSDFVNGQMPTSLSGVSVTFTGASGYSAPGYLYYISPTQLNVLAPPNLPTGVVEVQVTNNGNVSSPGSVAAQTLSPSFFVFDGTHVVAQHVSNYSDVGPTTLYPGLTTPASPGEEVVLYANGFGQTSEPVQTGASTQGGTLATLPVVTIGGINAQVIYAGLAGVGEYQFNVYIPSNAPSGDLPLVATYNGQTTQPGVVITVQ